MKNFYFIACLLLGYGYSHGQVVSFADPDFKAVLLAASTSNSIATNQSGAYVAIDTNGNGEIEVVEALQIRKISILNNPFIDDLTGISTFANLTVLSVSPSSLVSVDLSALTYLQTVHLEFGQISSIVLPPPGTLTNLYVGQNQLATLDVSQYTTLTRLDCQNNQISGLDVSSLANLTHLNCEGNQIGQLSLNAPNLTWLRCHSNQLHTLDLTEMTQLTWVECQNNLLSSIALPNSVAVLDCSHNLLSSLALPAGGFKINCSYNALTALELEGFSSIAELDCSHNQLSTLTVPANFANLDKLNCDNNQLTSLNLELFDYQYYSFYELRCANNQLTHLDLNNGGAINVLDCRNNQLQSLFIKSVYSLSQFDFGGNPGMHYICTSEGMIADAEQKAAGYGYDCVVNSYCTFTPDYAFYNLQGRVRLDIDSNGCTPQDVAYPQMRFEISNGVDEGTIIADQSGNYSIDVPAGQHIISPILEIPSYFSVSPTSVQVTFPAEPPAVTQDFCVTPIGVHADLEVSLIPVSPARPGFDANYKLLYRNKGNQVQSGTVSLSYDDPILDFVSANPAVASNPAGVLTWNFNDLQPFESRQIEVVLNVNSPMETPGVNAGDVISYAVSISSSSLDETPADNNSVLNQTVVNSFDPNDKTCVEGNLIGPEMVGQFVHYVIRFENTGTFSAQNIVVKDVIDASKFDIATLIPMHASHPFLTRVNGNTVEFIFENINLPFADDVNDGYVAFKIKTKPTLAVGDTFSNSASIYFDYNFPIVTEPAITEIQNLGRQDFEFEDYFSIYPNPAQNIVHVKAMKDIEVNSIAVYDVNGRQLATSINSNSIDVGGFAQGTYFVKVISGRGISAARFIKR